MGQMPAGIDMVFVTGWPSKQIAFNWEAGFVSPLYLKDTRTSHWMQNLMGWGLAEVERPEPLLHLPLIWFGQFHHYLTGGLYFLLCGLQSCHILHDLSYIGDIFQPSSAMVKTVPSCMHPWV